MALRIIGVLLVLVAVPLAAQIRVSRIERLPLPPTEEWSNPRFSPDGRSVFLTRPDFTGIWNYTLTSRALRQVTADRGAGYGFAVSPDGSRLAYRRLVPGKDGRRTTQEIVEKDLRSGSSQVRRSGRALSLPAFAGAALVFASEKNVEQPAHASNAVVVLGIEKTKILLLRGGGRVLFDPLGGGSYIWPSLSPDGTQLVASDMRQGAFVCDTEGAALTLLGKRNAPAWTRDARWIVYMKDVDDGHRLVSSDIYCVASDGSVTIQLTRTPDVLELDPHCSPIDNRIVCGSASGQVFLIDYSESAR